MKKPTATNTLQFRVEPCQHTKRLAWVRAFYPGHEDNPVCFTVHSLHGFDEGAAIHECGMKAVRELAKFHRDNPDVKPPMRRAA